MSLNVIQDHPLVQFPDFRRLFLGRLISALGDKIFTIALAWWVVSNGGESSKLMLSILMAVNVAPVVLFGPAMGTVADRVDRRRCMIVADAARAALVFTLLIALKYCWLAHSILFALVFATAAFSPLFESAASSSLAELTDEEHLGQAVAADGMVMNVSTAVGAFVGSVFIAFAGIGGAFLLNAVSFLVSLCFVWRIRTPLAPHAAQEPYLKQLREGLTFLVKDRAVISMTLLFALLNFFAAPLMLFIPMLVKFRLNTGVSWVALFEGALAVGSALTAFAISVRNPFRRTYLAMFGVIILMGLALIGVGLAMNRAILFGLFLLTGSTLAVVNTLALGLFQEYIPPAMKGRFFAILNTVCFAVIPFSFVTNGILSQHFPLKVLIILNGVLTLVLAVPLLFIERIPTVADQSIRSEYSEALEVRW